MFVCFFLNLQINVLTSMRCSDKPIQFVVAIFLLWKFYSFAETKMFASSPLQCTVLIAIHYVSLGCNITQNVIKKYKIQKSISHICTFSPDGNGSTGSTGTFLKPK